MRNHWNATRITSESVKYRTHRMYTFCVRNRKIIRVATSHNRITMRNHANLTRSRIWGTSIRCRIARFRIGSDRIRNQLTSVSQPNSAPAQFFDRRMPFERFWARVIPEPNSNCWLWLGPTNKGYGLVNAPWTDIELARADQGLPMRRPRTPVAAHRWAYAVLVGPIPRGLHLDHWCRVRCCVNPAHLEPVTQAENNHRAVYDHFTDQLLLALAGPIHEA